MLPKFLTHLDKKAQQPQQQQQQRRRRQRLQTPTTTKTRRWCCTFPLVLLGFVLVLHAGSSRAERDFNFNDSQVPLVEPKDEPHTIDHHTGSSSGSSSSGISSSTSSSSSINSLYQHQQTYHEQHYDEEDPYAVELSHCRLNDNEIVLSLVLKNYNWHDLNDSRKGKVLEKLSQFFAIPKEFITMESVTKHELFEMQKESLKKGTNKCHNNKRKLGRVNFIIGCGSTYFTVTEPISKQIGQQVRDGALDNITGEKFGWWVIWHKQNKIRLVRNRRQTEGSGDDDEDDDDYDYEDDTDDIDTTTSTTHAHRHHHGDETSEINSNMLEVTNIKNVNNDLQNIGNNKIDDNSDITALKQTDLSINEAVEEEVEKPDTTLLLSNKKGSIDEEIVESVSQLESVITKTIENTKNLEDVPDIVVDQPEEDLLSEVLRPINSMNAADTDTKSTDNLNLNELERDFGIGEVIDHTVAAATTANTNSLTTISSNINNTQAKTLAGISGQESFTESTTPFNSNKHLDFSLSSSASHGHSQHAPPQIMTEITKSLNNTHITPAIITDSTVSTTTTTTTTAAATTTNALYDSSFTLSTTPLSSSSISTSTMLSTVLKKYEMTSNSMPVENVRNNYNDDEDDNDADAEEEAGGDEKHKQVSINTNINAELLNTLMATATTAMIISPAPAITTTKNQQTEQSEHQQQHRQNHQYYTVNKDNSMAKFKTNLTEILAATTTNLATFSSLTPSPLTPTPPPSSSSSPLSLSTLDIFAVATPPTILSSLGTTATATSTASMEIIRTPAIHELPNENVFHIDIYGRKDETTVEPRDNQELNKLSTSTSQTTDEAAVSITTPRPTASTSQATTAAATHPTVAVVSSTTVLPDYVDPKIENTPPIIKSRLQKLAVTSGKSFKFSIPQDTFYDNEDLTNLRLELTDKEGRELKTNSWLQFNAETKEIYGLPLDDAVSKWQYRLTATDSGNESVTETLEISVQQHRGVRTVNHEINVSVKINEKNIHYIDWQLDLINAIAITLGDGNTSSIVVREIRANPQDPNTATLVYFNETLPTYECPERELNNLVKRLDVSRLSDLVQPTLGIKSLTGQLIGPCQKTASIKPKTPTLNAKNAPPVPRNQVDRVVATVGHLLVYKVPSDTFFDSNDNQLTLSLKTKDHKELSPRHWLQFDSKNEEFYGIPKSGDLGSEEYMLVAEDAGGLTATDALVVQVNHAPKRDFSAYIKVYLAIRHEQFNADLQRKFVERIAHLFGDASTQNIQIRSVTTHHDSDSTIVNFYNTTIFKSHNRCPEEEMEAIRSVYLQDYTLRERVKKILGPELNITNVQVIPLGSCNAPTDVTHREFVPNKTDEPLLKSTFSEDYLYTIILPAIIIVSMVIIATIIACCLHRRRRKSGKMELGDEEERKSFRTKGIPVIFQDELDEKPEIGNKSPIILKDEKPPLLPPSYNTSNMNGDNDVDEYVPPPAVIVGGREARGKSPATPSYRKPPPYVSP